MGDGKIRRVLDDCAPDIDIPVTRWFVLVLVPMNVTCVVIGTSYLLIDLFRAIARTDRGPDVSEFISASSALSC
jgi:hypothetical protein